MTLDEAIDIALADPLWYGLFRVPGGYRRVPVSGWRDQTIDPDGLINATRGRSSQSGPGAGKVGMAPYGLESEGGVG
jgi:hypothetical protein